MPRPDVHRLAVDLGESRDIAHDEAVHFFLDRSSLLEPLKVG